MTWPMRMWAYAKEEVTRQCEIDLANNHEIAWDSDMTPGHITNRRTYEKMTQIIRISPRARENPATGDWTEPFELNLSDSEAVLVYPQGCCAHRPALALRGILFSNKPMSRSRPGKHSQPGWYLMHLQCFSEVAQPLRLPCLHFRHSQRCNYSPKVDFFQIQHSQSEDQRRCRGAWLRAFSNAHWRRYDVRNQKSPKMGTSIPENLMWPQNME